MLPEEINKKLLSGFLTLTFRRVILLAISFFTINVILARVLTPSIIGVFDIANSIIAFFSFFSEIGLGAALIQKKEITHEDLKTTFTLQTILIFLVSAAVFLAAPLFGSIKGLDDPGVWLLRALAFAFFMDSFKAVPSLILERELKFKPLVTVELVEQVIFNGLLIILSFRNFGIEAFTIATIVRPICGVVVVYLWYPWKLAVGISKSATKILFGFGIPYQLNSMLALLKDRLVALVVAYLIGTTGVGFNSWAQNISFLPLEIVNVMIRISFPAFSRLQQDRASLRHSLERSTFLTTTLVYPLIFGTVAIAPYIVKYIVSSKWQPALPLIYFFSLAAFWATLSTPMTNFLSAIGKIKITLYLMVMWTILEWSLTPFLTLRFGYYGPALSSALISFSSIATIVMVKKNIEFDFIKSIWAPFLSSVLMAVLVYFIAMSVVFNWWSLLMVIAMGGLIYFGLMIIFSREKLIVTLKELR